VTLDAEISRKDGKIVARLIRGTGDKDIDDSILAILEAMKDSYADLKEGESINVQLDDPRKK
jgi:lysophospholipid acyltransferase (LPLAT)-like uncharacterized protein